MFNLLDQVLSNTTNTQPAAPVFSGREITPPPQTTPKTQVFTVDSLPLHSERGEIEGKKGLFVEKNCINVVSDRYEIHQPQEIIANFQELAEGSGLEVNKILTNPKNGGLLLSAKFTGTKIVGESHDVNLVFYTSHCGKYKTTLACNLLRVACFNQLPTLNRKKSRHLYAEKHYHGALDSTTFGKIIAQIPENVSLYNEQANTLIDKKFSFDDFVAFCTKKKILDEKHGKFDKKIQELRDVYYNATGQRGLGDSAYKAYQCLTFKHTHEVRKTPMAEETRTIKNVDESAELLLDLLELTV